MLDSKLYRLSYVAMDHSGNGLTQDLRLEALRLYSMFLKNEFYYQELCRESIQNIEIGCMKRVLPEANDSDIC